MEQYTIEQLDGMKKADLVTLIMDRQERDAKTVNSVELKLSEVEADLEAEKAVKGNRVKSLQSQASRLRKHLKLLKGEQYGDKTSTKAADLTPELMLERIAEAKLEIVALKPQAETSLTAYKKIASLQSKISVSRRKWKELTGKAECPA